MAVAADNSVDSAILGGFGGMEGFYRPSGLQASTRPVLSFKGSA